MKKLLFVIMVGLMAAAAWCAWQWFFCRFYVPADHMAILVAKTGKPLEPGQILANPGQRGVREEVLAEGRHFRNPVLYEWKIVPVLQVPSGKIGMITSKVGRDLPSGEFLADEGEKGIRRKVLGPGKYRINPQGYAIDIVDATVVPIGYVGVVTSLDGVAPKEGKFAEPGERGVRRNVLQPGLYYINPKQFKVDIVEIGINQISLLSETGGKNIEFPSRDGFEIKVDTTVEFELLPKHIPGIFSRYGNLQAVIDKIILPQILSISRLKGSAYGARDFIVGEGREKFQNEFTDELVETLQAKDIEILSALIRHVTVPDQILSPIQDASVAQLRNLTNIEKQTTAKKLAELNTERTLIEQKREQIQQETKKIKAEIKAQQDKEVAEINAQTQRSVVEIEKETALVKADTKRKIGKADADVTQMVGEAQADGFRLMVNAFKDPHAYSMYVFAGNLPPDMKIAIAHTGPGTLWTDLSAMTQGRLAELKILEESRVSGTDIDRNQ